MKAKFVLSKSKLLEQYNLVKNLSDSVSYSLKTNPVVGKVLEDLTDCWFSVHFIQSLEFIKDKKRITFIGQSWSSDDLDILFKNGVRSFIVDNERDLDTLLDYIKDRNCMINLFLRMKMKEYTIKTEKHFVFGMYSSQINELIPKLRKNSKLRFY